VFDTIFGLPVHILVIHAVVVLVPLCALAVLVMVVSRTWRDRLRWPLLVLVSVALVSTFVARESGEQLQARLAIASPAIIHHANLGRAAWWIVLAFWAVVVVWLVVDGRAVGAARAPATSAGPGTATRQGARTGSAGAGTSSARWVGVLGVLAAVMAVGATSWIVLTGDAGSRAVWQAIVQSTNRH
jgi:hypothetical protein